MRFFGSPFMDRIRGRLERLYPGAGERCLERMAMLVGRYGVGMDTCARGPRWSEQDAVLITYGAMVRSESEDPLQTLNRFLHNHLRGAVNLVHILPFFPFSSDDGFSVIDYRSVNPVLGSWQDIEAIGRDFDLMFDLVLNHGSRQSAWFADYVAGVLPGRNYFIEMGPGTDLSRVVRPRNLPLLTAVKTSRGERLVWTTFSSDQIDLNFATPDVLFEFLDILFLYIARGVRVIRLDAIAYLWKKVGTSCIHLPETHEVVKLIRDVVDMVAPHVVILTETNVPHRENISYFGDGDEAHMVYQFTLPPLLLHTLLRGDATRLTAWARDLAPSPAGCTFFNFTASHDGIGVRPAEGILAPDEFKAMIADVRRRGGHVSSKTNSDGSESPYELNITYPSALADPDGGDPALDGARFLCSQTVALALRGIPGIYFNSLVAARNDDEAVERSQQPRAINRTLWDMGDLSARIADSTAGPGYIMREYVQRLRVRTAHAAFHPDAPQRVLDLDPAVFAVERTAPDESEKITALHNVTAETVTVKLDRRRTSLARNQRAVDLLSDEVMQGEVTLTPYQCRWLTALA